MHKFFAFLSGVMSGAIVGAAVALLLAPMSGEALQAEINARFAELKSEMEAAVTEQEKKLRAEFERMKESAA